MKAGESAIVSLVPKAQFNARLAVAAKALVKQTVTIAGKKKTSSASCRSSSSESAGRAVSFRP